MRGRDYYWVGFAIEPSKPDEGTDLRAIHDGKISVTPLHVDLTHMPSVHDLKAKLGGAPPKV
jgi:5'-nucleotidase